MPFGYTGQNQPNQTVSNSGVFSITDVAELQSQGKLGGSLELIDTQIPNGSSTTIEFTNLQESKYDVHLFRWSNIEWTGGADTVRVRVSNDNGSTYESGSVYDTAYQSCGTSGSFSEVTRLNYDSLDRIMQNLQNTPYSGYMYMYNAGNSSKYTFFTLQAYFANAFRFGGGVYKTAETINALKFYNGVYNLLNQGFIKLYGVKQI